MHGNKKVLQKVERKEYISWKGKYCTPLISRYVTCMNLSHRLRKEDKGGYLEDIEVKKKRMWVEIIGSMLLRNS